MSKNRIQGLDNLRGIAALTVCLFHLMLYNFPRPLPGVLAVIKAILSPGWLGVELFFVISGFIIPYSLHRNGYTLRSYPRFIARRIVRLDPPYIAAVILALAVGIFSAKVLRQQYHLDVVGLILHLGYLNVFYGEKWLNAVFWTLAIEVQYYVLIGLTFPLTSSSNRYKRWFFYTLCAVSYFVLDGTRTIGAKGPYDPFIFHFLPLFGLGIATFQFWQGIIRKAEYVILLAVMAGACLYIDSWISTIAGLVAVLCINFWTGRNRVVDFLGKISYSLYLVHWPIIQVVASIASAKVFGLSVMGITLSLLLSLTASLIGAYLLYLTVESPAQEWAKRIRYKVGGAEVLTGTSAKYVNSEVASYVHE